MNFEGDLYLKNSTLNYISFAPFDEHPPRVTIVKNSDFSGTQCLGLRARSVDFMGRSNFKGFRAEKELILWDVSFQNDVDFSEMVFPRSDSPPPKPSIDQLSRLFEPEACVFSEVRFDKGIELNWLQLAQSTNWLFADNPRPSADMASWKSLGAAFKRSENLKGQNESFYFERLQALSEDRNENRLANRLSWFIWGYGHRPLRVLFWLVISISGFAMIYWTQSKRLYSAFEFSIRNSISLNYGFKNATTVLFKVVTGIQSILSKVLSLLFL